MVANRCLSLRFVASRCLSLLIVACNCLSLFFVACRFLSVPIVPPLPVPLLLRLREAANPVGMPRGVFTVSLRTPWKGSLRENLVHMVIGARDDEGLPE